MSTLKRVVRGIRQKLPQGYLLGRRSAGEGPVEMLTFSDVAKVLSATPGATSQQSAAMSYGLAANRPTAPNVPAGQLAFYYATDTLTLTVWTGSAWVSVGGGGGGLFGGLMSATPPTQSGAGFNTWVNQGSATMADVAGAGISFACPANASASSIKFKHKTSPATPYTALALFTMNDVIRFSGASNNAGIAFGWYDGTNKVHGIEVYPGGGPTGVREVKYTNPTTQSSQTLLGYAEQIAYVWARIKDDGTNISGDVSVDGTNWFNVIATIAKASAFNGSAGYGHILIGADPFNAIAGWTLTSYAD